MFSLVLLILLLCYLVWPFHIFYYSFRKSIIVTLIRNFFPLGKNGVRFRDFMFGDVLTSLVRPLSSLSLSFCLMSCEECHVEHKRFDCNRNSTMALCLILSPFIIRLFQCLNRYYYTKMAWPHLGNALKYTGGITYNIFSWLYANNKDLYYYEFLFIGLVANSYMLFWDLYMDWNLARSFKRKNFFLRDKIVYPKWMYYTAIVTNTILRFTWLTSLPTANSFIALYISDELKVFYLSIFEIIRRTQWSLFRIENENTNNPEKYRAVLEIPELHDK